MIYIIKIAIALAVTFAILVFLAVKIKKKQEEEQRRRKKEFEESERRRKESEEAERRRKEYKESLIQKAREYNACFQNYNMEKSGRKSFEKLSRLFCLAGAYAVSPDMDVQSAIGSETAYMEKELERLYQFSDIGDKVVIPNPETLSTEDLEKRLEHVCIPTVIPYREAMEQCHKAVCDIFHGDLDQCITLRDCLSQCGFVFIWFDELLADDEKRVDYYQSIYGCSYPGLYYKNDKGYFLASGGGVKK